MKILKISAASMLKRDLIVAVPTTKKHSQTMYLFTCNLNFLNIKQTYDVSTPFSIISADIKIHISPHIS